MSTLKQDVSMKYIVAHSFAADCGLSYAKGLAASTAVLCIGILKLEASTCKGWALMLSKLANLSIPHASQKKPGLAAQAASAAVTATIVGLSKLSLVWRAMLASRSMQGRSHQ